jgi:energy-coupling factor transport system permease protein
MNIELVKNIGIGQYMPLDSIIHRLDPRTKLIGATALLVAITVSSSIIANLLLLAAICAIVWLSRVPFGFLLRPVIKGAPTILLFFLIVQIYLGWLNPPGQVYFEAFDGWIRFTRAALYTGILSFTRLLSYVLLLSLPSLTTPITQLSHGLELLLMPFRRIGVPAHEIALMNTIALRFVPTLAMELESVAKAQASRLGDIGNAGRRPDKLARALLPLIVPLFVGAFRRAEELAIAMEARCYMSNSPRTKMTQLTARRVDTLASIGVIAFTVFVALFRWPPIHVLANQLIGMTRF